jgi:hypothetical protein
LLQKTENEEIFEAFICLFMNDGARKSEYGLCGEYWCYVAVKN